MKTFFRTSVIISLVLVFVSNANAQWQTSGNHIYNSNSGSVGIGGVPNPDYTLDVIGSWAFRQTGYFYSTLYSYEQSTGQYLHFFTSGGKGYVGMNSLNDLILQSYGGKVGIGTSTPGRELHIKSSTGSQIMLESTSSGDWSGLQWSEQTGLYSAYSGLNGSDGRYFVDLNSDGEDLTILQNGEVGIGTTTPSPGYKLTVKGGIHAKEVKVDLDFEGPDYVFEANYPLASLEDTKAYVEQNKHLPGIPSSDDMQQNGVNLLEMNMKLLEKVEELTLHLIEQQRVNDEQGQRINFLEQKIK